MFSGGIGTLTGILIEAGSIPLWHCSPLITQSVHVLVCGQAC